jgi:phosphinothricin acetyltransferase
VLPLKEAVVIRRAQLDDAEAIRCIYNEAVADRLATLDTDPKSREEMAAWWAEHNDRFAVLVALEHDTIVGWASLNRFSHRCAHSAIADLSVYVAPSHRGRGVGSALLRALELEAAAGGFHKIILHALDANEHGKRLYRKAGFVEVGIFREHGILGGRYVDVIAMEKLLLRV